MEQSKALSRLLDAADLLAMLEDLTAGPTSSRMSPSVMSGLRLTIRNAREVILSSHDTLASTLVSKARGNVELSKDQETTKRADVESQSPLTARAQGESPTIMKRNDLRASLERIIER
ncbi:MAG: hypothetical protein K1X79_13225 [Oligoflexia bacterium]|nr:hypothetical protein [Oligoflexia bacterium]